MSSIRHWGAVTLAAVLTVIGAALSMATALAPRSDAPIVAWFALPSAEAARRAIAAGTSALIGFGAVPGAIVIAGGDDALPERLRRAGALFVTRAPGAAACSERDSR